MRSTRPIQLTSKPFRLAILLLFFCALLGAPKPVHAATYTVNTEDFTDDGTCDARHCSLLEAVRLANENPGPDVIHFNIPGTGPHAIVISREDFFIEDDATTIDGTTQPGYSSAPEGYGTPAVALVGSPYEDPYLGPVPSTPIAIRSDNNVIRGLSIINCADANYLPWAVYIHGSGNLIEHNYINIYPGGDACVYGIDTIGIEVGNNGWPRDSSYFRGGIVANAILGNVIATSYIGIQIEGADDTVVLGNRIGTDPGGSWAPNPYFSGVFDLENSIGTMIGGSGPGEGNLIAGAYIGVLARGEAAQIIGNRVGTDAAGTAAIPNYNIGVWVMGSGCVVEGNLISGNPVGVQVGGEYRGGEISVGDVTIYSPYPGGFDVPILLPGSGVVIKGNQIGTDLSGTRAIANEKGILLEWNAESAQIGGAGEGEGNLISGNDFGIEVKGGTPVIIGNRIGTNLSGTAAIPNEYGILVWDRAGVTWVGGNEAGEGNLISGNTRTGLWFRADSGYILENWVGLSADGEGAIANDTGIVVDGSRNIIGGMDFGVGNVISGNDIGIVVDGDHNNISSNLIGTDPSGTTAIPNRVGIYLSGSRNNMGFSIDPNLVSGNERGLVITGSENAVYNTYVGTDASATLEIPNGVGIELLGPANRIGDESSPGNQVLYNNGPGILISSLAVGNSIMLNTIAYNSQEGIRVEAGGGVAQNTFTQNSIFRNSWLGIDLLPGAQDDIAMPVFEGIRLVEGGDEFLATGSACTGCLVELFIADPDRSGYGEGKTYVASDTASGGGFSFSIPAEEVRSLCQPFTLTATDSAGNTSEFADNMTPLGCLNLRWIIILIGVVGFTIPGIIIGLLVGGRRGRPGTGAAAGGVVGGLVGILVIFILTRFPFVHIVPPQVPQGGEGASASLPPCAQFIAGNQIHPEDLAVFDLGTDVLFELSPQPDPPGSQTEWTLALTGPGGVDLSQVLPEGSIALSGLGVEEPLAGTYAWRISAERLDPATNQWEPWCADIRDRVFFLVEPQAVSEPPTATPGVEANCREGPTTDYPLLSILHSGQQFEIRGRNNSGDAWLVYDPAIEAACWVAGSLVEVTGDTSDVITIILELPLPPVTEEPVVVDCSQWSSDQPACIANPACEWQPNLFPSDPCRNK